MLWALIMPRSATTQMRPTLKRACNRSDDRQQGGDIGGVAGPQLAAQRPAVLIHDQPDDHLMEIRAVVFRMAATTKLRAAACASRACAVVRPANTWNWCTD